MAVKQFYHDIDLVNVGQLVGARLQNVSTTARNALAAQLGAANTGLTVYDTTEKKQYTWDGVMFQADALEVIGSVVFKGEINAANAAAVEKEVGFQYVAGEDFTLTLGAGPTAVSYPLEMGDLVLFTSATTAVVTQRNDVTATEAVSGNIKLATQAEVNAGMVMDEAVTPATLHGYVDPIFAAKDAKDAEQDGRLGVLEADVAAIEAEQIVQNGRLTSLEADRVKHFFATVNLTAGAPATVTHNLNLADRDGFVIRTSFGNSDISLDVDSVGANSLTLTSLVPLTGVKVFIVGRAAA